MEAVKMAEQEYCELTSSCGHTEITDIYRETIDELNKTPAEKIFY